MALKEKLIDKAQKLIQKGAYDKAVAEYRAVLEVDPRDISIRLRIGDLFVKLGKHPDAIKEYTEAAKANAQRGFYLKAIAVYKQVLKLDDSLEVHNKLAELYSKQRLIADAISEYSYIVSWFERKGKTNEVLELLKKMVEIDPENIGVRLKLAELYQKLSFDKDALAEYTFIFDKLLSQGKLDKAEKVYLALYNSNPAEERVISGLAEVYRLKGDQGQHLRFLKVLLNHYIDSARTEDAKSVADSILAIKPDETEANRFLRRFRKEEEAGIRLEVNEADLSIARSVTTEPPLVSWPEEELEVPAEAPPAEEASAPEARSVAAEAEASGPADEIEIDIDDLIRGEIPAPPAEAASPATQEEPPVEIEVELPAAAELSVQEASAVEEPSSMAGGAPDAGAMAEIELEVEADAEPEAEIDIPDAPAAEAATGGAPAEPEEAIEAVADAVEQPVAEVAAEAGPEPVEPVDIELQAGYKAEAVEDVAPVAPVAEEAAVDAGPPQAAVEAEAPAEEQALEIPELEAAIDSANAAIEPDEGAVREAEPIEPQAIEIEEVRIEFEPPIEAAPAEEAAPADPGPHAAMEAADGAGLEPVIEDATAPEAAVEAQAEAPETLPEAEELPEELQEDLSSAIQELMEKIEPDEPPAAAVDKPAEAEEYVDLSAELGMEEALKDLAEPWGGKEPKDTFDEFKTGIEKQLSKEDSETHYNLGIAYMEMELHNEASKEFKIALKDPRLEFDCYTRLGLCSMAAGNPEEAVLYYLKGLKVEGRSNEERIGMMYELALAYEAAGSSEEAVELFRGIHALDPAFREAGEKVRMHEEGVPFGRPMIPLDDGLIEVELL